MTFGSGKQTSIYALNEDKAEMLLIKLQCHKSIDFLHISCMFGDEEVEETNLAGNKSTLYDSVMSVESEVIRKATFAFMHLRNIWKIRKYLTRHVTKTIVHVFIISQLHKLAKYSKYSWHRCDTGH